MTGRTKKVIENGIDGALPLKGGFDAKTGIFPVDDDGSTEIYDDGYAHARDAFASARGV